MTTVAAPQTPIALVCFWELATLNSRIGLVGLLAATHCGCAFFGVHARLDGD